MAFTSVELTGTFQSPTPASGTLTFTLTQAITNGDVVLAPSPVTVTLDEGGRFSLMLAANDDAATIPQGVRYGVTEQIAGAQPRDYFILVPHATSPVDISTLMPGEQGWT